MNQPYRKGFVVIVDAGANRRSRFIAVLKPAQAHDERVVHAMQLLNSMLWAFKGALSASWVAAEPEAADVIVVHRDDRRALTTSWRARGKLIVEIETRGTVSSPDPLLLVYPFRARQVRTLLERLDDQLRARSNVTASVDGWRFVETLRAMRNRTGENSWVAARSSGVHFFWIQSNAARYVAEPATIEALRSGSLNLSEMQLSDGPPPPGAAPARSGVELLWHAGYHARSELAERFHEIAAFHLVRWPNFGAIRPAGAQIRIVAAIASGESQVSRIAARANANDEEVVRTLNALLAADLITASSPANAVELKAWQPPVQPRKGFTAFLRDVRRHLGLGVVA